MGWAAELAELVVELEVVAGEVVVVREVLAVAPVLERRLALVERRGLTHRELERRELERLAPRVVPRGGLEHQILLARLELELPELAHQVLAFRGVDPADRAEQDLKEGFLVLLRELAEHRLPDLLGEATMVPQVASQALLQVWAVVRPVLMALAVDMVVPPQAELVVLQVE